MSTKLRPHYADQKGAVTEGFDGKVILAEGPTVPANGTAGFAPGCTFYKRGGAAGTSLYINEGTALSSTFVPLAAQTGGTGTPVTGVAAGYRIARGVATITGSGTVVTGLTTVVSVTATMQNDASLTNGTGTTATVGDQAGTPAAGSVILKVWKPTSSADGTPIASAVAVQVNWIAVGT